MKDFFKQEDCLEVITSKVVVATPEEVQQNPSSRSAKLRVAQMKKNETK